jgi:hypothetical protein
MKLAGVLLSALGLAVLFFLPGFAEDENVAVFVTPCTVAAAVNDGSVGFSTLGLSPSSASPFKRNTNPDDPNGVQGQRQTITNTGSCAAEVHLSATNAIGGLVPWDLVACNAVGQDAFGLQYEVGDAGGTFAGAAEFPPDNSMTSTVGNVPATNGAVTLDIGICMPTISTVPDIKRVDVTVTLIAITP